MKKIIFKKTLFFSTWIVSLLIILASYDSNAAEPYFIKKQINIVTEYPLEDNGKGTKEQIWTVVPHSNGNSFVTLEYSTKRAGKLNVICKVNINRKIPKYDIAWEGHGRQKKLSGVDGLLIIPGYPVPCDIFPILQEKAAMEYTIENIAGGRTFLEKYNITIQPENIETAIRNGWIKNEIEMYSGIENLFTVTLFNEKEEAVAMQLWSSKGEWWIYEETPHRQSWLLQ